MAEEEPEGGEQPEEKVGLVEALDAAFEQLDGTVASLVHLAPSFALLRQPLRRAGWPHPGPPKRGGGVTRTLPPVEAIPPVQVLESWRTGGRDWLVRASRRELRAARVALADDAVGPQLVQEDGFLALLLSRLRPLQQQRVLLEVLFCVFPPPPVVLELLGVVSAEKGMPPWWSERASLPGLLRSLAVAVRAEELVEPGDLGVAASAWRTGWAEAIVAERPPRSIDDVRKQLCFARAGREPSQGALSPAVVTALRQGIELAVARSTLRRPMAALASQHVGSPFGPDAEARWRPLGKSLQRVRQWLAGELIRIVFQHLVPPSPRLAHMAKPRREFWSKYTGSVRRMWVAVTWRIQHQLKHPDVVELEETMGDDFVICDLSGGPDQAVVWMQLEGRQGPVTVIEGNANTSIRIRKGAWRPPDPPSARRFYPRPMEIKYRDDIVHGTFASAHVWRTTHKGSWESGTERELLRLGIRKDSR